MQRKKKKAKLAARRSTKSSTLILLMNLTRERGAQQCIRGIYNYCIHTYIDVDTVDSGETASKFVIGRILRLAEINCDLAEKKNKLNNRLI